MSMQNVISSQETLTDPNANPSTKSGGSPPCTESYFQQNVSERVRQGFSNQQIVAWARQENKGCRKKAHEFPEGTIKQFIRNARHQLDDEQAKASTASHKEQGENDAGSGLSPEKLQKLHCDVDVQMSLGLSHDSIVSSLRDKFGELAVHRKFEQFWEQRKCIGDDCYCKMSGGLYKPEGAIEDGRDERHLAQIANFAVKKFGKVIFDDGANTETEFELEAVFGDRTLSNITLRNESFHRMEWPPYVIHPGAIVAENARDASRVAIQLTSDKPPARHVYTHTGWREITDHGNSYWVYLHANGAIGAKGQIDKLKAEPRSTVKTIALPKPPEGQELKAAIRTSLKFLELGPDVMVMPVYAAIWRAPLPSPTLTLWVFGPTGVFKTAITLLAMKHYGAQFAEEHISHWNSTDNSLLLVLHEAKDALWPVDDFVPAGNQKDRDKQNASSDNIIRGTANHAGRGRLNRGAQLQPTKEPRALMLSTGEARPAGHSKGARTIFDRFSKDGIDVAHLTSAQADGASGAYALAMAGYLQFLAAQYDTLPAYVQKRTAELREMFSTTERHPRIAENLASLSLGIEMKLKYAVEAKAITKQESDELWKRWIEATRELAKQQDEYQTTEDPVTEAIEMLRTANASGRVCLDGRVDDVDARVPCDQHAIKLGHLDDDQSWMCLPDVLFSTVQKLWQEQHGSLFPLDRDTFLGGLKDRGLIDTEEGRFVKRASAKWPSVDGSRPRIVYIKASSFTDLPQEDQTEPPAQSLGLATD